MLGTIIGAGIMSAGSLLGNYYQAKAQQKINEQNLRFQEEANRLSVELANTAHQREVKDLRAAGLNPILSAGGSGASTPQIGAITAENPYSGLANSASSVSREVGRLFTDQVALDMDQTSAQTENLRAQKVAIESDAELKLAMADSIRAGRGIFDLGSETITPAAETFGEWIGNSAFKAKEWLKSQFSTPNAQPPRIPYHGRYVTMEWLFDHDKEYLYNWLDHQKRK